MFECGRFIESVHGRGTRYPVVLRKDAPQRAIDLVLSAELESLSHRLCVQPERQRLECHVVGEADAPSLEVVLEERVQLSVQVVKIETHLVEDVLLKLIEHD